MKSKTKLPRKLKKKVQQIPIGSYCYADITIGDYEKAKRLKKNIRTYKKKGSFSCIHSHKNNYCALLKIHDGLLSDSVKICGIHEMKDALSLKDKIGKEQLYVSDNGKQTIKFDKDGSIIFLKEEADATEQK